MILLRMIVFVMYDITIYIIYATNFFHFYKTNTMGIVVFVQKRTLRSSVKTKSLMITINRYYYLL